GFARRELPDFVEEMRRGCDQHARRRPVDPLLWEGFSRGVSYVAGNFDDLDAYLRLKQHLEAIDRARGTLGNRVYYLATPPSYYPEILRMLGESGLVD